MFNFKRVLLFAMAFVLLPLGPAQAVAEDEILWRGTVITKLENSSDIYYPSNGTRTSASEVFRSKLTFLGNGSVTEEIWYTYQGQFPAACSSTWIDTGWETREGYLESPTKTFGMVKTDSWVYLTLTKSILTATTRKYEGCGAEEVVGTYVVNHPGYLTLQSTSGEFSADSTEVFGLQKGFNFYYPLDSPAVGFNSGHLETFYYLTGTVVDNPWLDPYDKQALEDSAEILDNYGFLLGLGEAAAEKKLTGKAVLGRALMVFGLAMDAASLMDNRLAKEPIDPNYTEIAIPVTPTSSLQPIHGSGDLTQEQADAFNALIINIQQGIGLGQAMITCFDRASGAKAANESYWVDQQLQAARLYSGQYADVLEARPQLMEDLKQALQTNPSLQFDITRDDIAQFHYELAANGLSAQHEQIMAEMGMDERSRTEILYRLIQAELPQQATLQDPVAQFPDLLTDPDLIASTQALAAALREFAQGQGWRVNLPFIIR